MLQIQIDGKTLEVQQGTTVMEAAQQLGNFIPHFCYHKKLSIAANCRMCLVEVEKVAKPLPACATPVTDGMIVNTHSPKAKQAQQGVMEFLLINHPLDCPICDQGGECQLQDIAVGYGQSSSRYQEEKRVVDGKDMGPLVSAAEMSRCIHCTRCVRFTEEISGIQEIGIAHRGEFSEIMPFIGKVVESELSGNVIDLCPVGALTSKPYRYDSRSWELSRRKSISAHDALGSNLIVQTKDHTVRRVLPLENEAINECWISDKDRFAYEGLNHSDRLQNPKIKHDGQWHDVDWATALDYVRKTLHCVMREEGQDAVGIWANPANTLEELYLTKKLAKNLGIHHLSSHLHTQDHRLHDALVGAQWLGQSIESLLDNDAIFVIGANLRQEQALLTARLRSSARKFMKVSVLNDFAENLHMPVLSQEIIHPAQWATFVQALSSNLQHEITQSLKNGQKTAILLGAQAQNSPDYATLYDAVQNLAAQTGSVVGILPQAANSVGADFLSFDSGMNMQEMLQKPRKAVLLMNVEPDVDVAGGAAVMTSLVQAQTVMAFTAFESEALRQVCDVLLPIAPYTETSGSFINMEGRLQSFHGVVKALGESRPLWKILRVLGNVFEFSGFDYDNSEQVLAEILDQYLGENGKIIDKLNNRSTWQGEERVWPALIRTGGISIYSTDAIVRRANALQKTMQAKEPEARVHPNTLSQLGLSGEKRVRVKQGMASVQVGLKADDKLPENTVYLPHHSSNAILGGMMAEIELERE